MNKLAKLALLLVVVLVSLSAYLRLAHSGIGCPDWPACYGRIGPPPAASPAAGPPNAYQRMGDDANEPLAWATPLHRLVASVLGLIVLGLNLLAWRARRQRLITLALLGLTVYLAVLGIRSGSLHDPAVVMGNLTGGFLMLALLGWLVMAPRPGAPDLGRHRWLKRWAVLGIVVLAGQILLGGLTSANFAATACRTLPDCHGAWLPGPALRSALDLSRAHQVTPSGVAVGGGERIAIHQAHRLGALLTTAVLLVAGFLALRGGAGLRTTGIAVLLLVLAEFGLGIAAVLAGLPIGLAVAHNWLAALLLLGLLRLLALARAGSV